MTDTPRWDLAAAESAVASLDLAREVGAAVGVPAVVLDPSPTDPDDRWDAVLGRLAPLAVVTVAEWGRADVIGPVDELVAAIIARPQAATTTAVHLRNLPEEPSPPFTRNRWPTPPCRVELSTPPGWRRRGGVPATMTPLESPSPTNPTSRSR